MATSILIVKLSSMGDVIHTLPAVGAIRRAYPKATIGWAIERAHAGLLDAHPLVDRLVVWDRKNWRTARRFVSRLRETRWDVAIDFQGLLRSGLVTRLSGARRRIGYRPTRERAHWFYNDTVHLETMDRHAVERNLTLAARLEGVTTPGPLTRSYLTGGRPSAQPDEGFDFHSYMPDETRRTVDPWLTEMGFDPDTQRLVAICPDCRKAANRWPPERFVELTRRLLDRDGVRVVICGGPASRELCDTIAEACRPRRVWRADGRFNLQASMALLARADVAVTGDTGPMHMAVAVGTRVVALFGPANPLRTGPYSDRAAVLYRHLSCSPCFARHCPLGQDPPNCMLEIGVGEVEREVALQLERATEDAQVLVRRRSA